MSSPASTLRTIAAVNACEPVPNRLAAVTSVLSCWIATRTPSSDEPLDGLSVTGASIEIVPLNGAEAEGDCDARESFERAFDSEVALGRELGDAGDGLLVAEGDRAVRPAMVQAIPDWTVAIDVVSVAADAVGVAIDLVGQPVTID